MIRRYSLRGCVFALAVLLASLELKAADREAMLFADAAAGRLRSLTWWEAVLTAGGGSPAEDQRYLQQIGELRQKLLRQRPAGADSKMQARWVLQFLHREIFAGGKYRVACTRLQETLDSGDYNCVTATCLFYGLCQDLRLRNVKIISEPEHVYCKLEVFPKAIEIQTTSPQGYNTRQGGAASRTIDVFQLTGKIYYNRGVRAVSQKRWQEAWDHYQKAARLDPQDSPTQQNQLACLNNWALAECQQGRYQQASQLLRYGLKLDPRDEPLRENESYIYYHWTQALCRQAKYAEAVKMLEAGYRRRPELPIFADGRTAVYKMWGQYLQKQGRGEEAQRAFAAAQRSR